jgi:hypothetical protein
VGLRCHPFHGFTPVIFEPFLGLAPQALCFRPLRGLRALLLILSWGSRFMLSPASRASRPFIDSFLGLALYAFARFAGFAPFY